jgi:hypothetical protein
MYPLALIKNGKNYNYYDSPTLYNALKEDIIRNLKLQMQFGLDQERAICLGKKNLEFLNDINKQEKMFKVITLLEHPRYIQQYKARSIPDYILKYKNALRI